MKRNVLVALLALAGTAGVAQATVLDMRPAGANQTSGFLNGGFYQRGDIRAAGTGIIQSFVRVSSNNATVEGYNTSGRPLFYDENNSPQFTRNLTFGQVPTVIINGVSYKEFLLDINQQGAAPFLSLDNVQIRIGATGNVNGAFGAAHGTLIYNMDVGPDGDSRVDLDYNLNSGSGQTDMAMYIPVASFTGASAGTFIYLYSHFGIPFGNNDGFEEWAVQTPETLIVPLPTAALAGGALLLAAMGLRMRSRR